MNKRISFITGFCLYMGCTMSGQTAKEQYEAFRKIAESEYHSFRDECNQKYAQFLKGAWCRYECNAPLPQPEDEKPVPPKPFVKKDTVRISTEPVIVNPIKNSPQPKPVEPIKEKPMPQEKPLMIDFFGNICGIRLPESAKAGLEDCKPNSISERWMKLSGNEMDNTLRDCLETRIRYNLCDWAYLMFLNKLGQEFCPNQNDATLLTAFLYCQSGYQMRLAVDNGNLVLLYGSKYQIYNKEYYKMGDTFYYPLLNTSKSISICDAEFEGETPMSLVINKEQKFDTLITADRPITSKRYADIRITSSVPKRLIDFYNEYPTAIINGNMMTRWALYANTPLAQKTKDKIYPDLKKEIGNLGELDAVERLLNLVQTGLEYEYDNKVWGHDRAFFAEESLYYPYCDCEDRSILFSRLVRDLLGLDVALIYYPGHLATAVCFNGNVSGDTMLIDGRNFVVCDPTYIGAGVGYQMPDLEYNKAQAILLNR